MVVRHKLLQGNGLHTLDHIRPERTVGLISRTDASCMRCVSACPAKARKVSGLMTSIAALAIKKACSVRKANELFL